MFPEARVSAKIHKRDAGGYRLGNTRIEPAVKKGKDPVRRS